MGADPLLADASDLEQNTPLIDIEELERLTHSLKMADT